MQKSRLHKDYYRAEAYPVWTIEVYIAATWAHLNQVWEPVARVNTSFASKSTKSRQNEAPW